MGGSLASRDGSARKGSDMTLLYKITDAYGYTRNNTQWDEGVEHRASGMGKLCGPGWLHAYVDPLQAALMHPAHTGWMHPLLWEADGDVGASTQTIVGCTRLKTLRQIPFPEITPEQRVQIALLCVKTVYGDAKWNAWADRWLSGEDRSEDAARVASHMAAERASMASAALTRRTAWAAFEAATAAEGPVTNGGALTSWAA